MISLSLPTSPPTSSPTSTSLSTSLNLSLSILPKPVRSVCYRLRTVTNKAVRDVALLLPTIRLTIEWVFVSMLKDLEIYDFLFVCSKILFRSLSTKRNHGDTKVGVRIVKVLPIVSRIQRSSDLSQTSFKEPE